MPDVALFCEDSFHEKFVGAMLKRFAAEYRVSVQQKSLSAQGGLPGMQEEFRLFLRDVSRQRQRTPHSIVVVADANCQGYNVRRDLLDTAATRYPELRQIVSYAIPDPHIERWMLVDPRAFPFVFGRGCTLPGLKCAKDEYKRLLRKEILESGIEAPLGGQEYAEDIVMAMNLGQVEVREPSLGLFLKTLKARFNAWRVP